MIIIPALDLRAGKCVRLVQGDFARERVYSEDPVAVASHWVACGAPLLHVVDLDGAVAGRPQQLDLVRSIASAVACPIQVGGGLRTFADLEAAFAAGASRVVIGTAALEHPELLTAALAAWGPERIIVSVDARNGAVVVRGWQQESAISALALVRQLQHHGVRHIVYTNTMRDGTLGGPDIDGVAVLARTGIGIIASGGIATRPDLVRLAAIPGVEGAIVGRALYDGTLDLRVPADWRIEAGGRAGQDEAEGL